MKTLQSRVSRAEGGFSLVSVTLAIGVFGFALTAILGLISIGESSGRTAIEQTGADALLSTVIADIRSTPRTAPGAGAITQGFHLPIPANPVTQPSAASTLYFDGEGRSTTSLQPDSRYRLDLTFLPNASARAATRALLQVTWPAPADPSNAAGSLSLFAAFDRN